MAKKGWKILSKGQTGSQALRSVESWATKRPDLDFMAKEGLKSWTTFFRIKPKWKGWRKK